MEELVEESIREGKILDESRFRDRNEYSDYMWSLFEKSYNRGIDMDKFLGEFLSTIEATYMYMYPILLVKDRKDLELARIWLKYMRTYKGESAVVDLLYMWPSSDPRLGEFVRSLPDLDYNEMLEYTLSRYEWNYHFVRLIIELGGDKVDYIKLMNDERSTGTTLEDVLVRIIASQV